MSDILKAAKEALDWATRGRAVQFHPSYCKEADGTPFSEWDTSHDLSVIRADGSRYKIGRFRHADDAMFDQWCRNNVPALIARTEQAEAEAAALRNEVARLTRGQAAQVLWEMLYMENGAHAGMTRDEVKGLWDKVSDEHGYAAVTAFLEALRSPRAALTAEPLGHGVTADDFGGEA